MHDPGGNLEEEEGTGDSSFLGEGARWRAVQTGEEKRVCTTEGVERVGVKTMYKEEAEEEERNEGKKDIERKKVWREELG